MNNDPSLTNLDSQALLNQIVLDYMKDKKRNRRWRFIKRMITVCLLLILLIFLWKNFNSAEVATLKEHIGLIDINGEISDSKNANADNFSKGMDSAYKNKSLKAMIIRINSPGGSPVQAEYIYNTIQYFKRKFPKVKTYAVCTDICASAAYYIAAATDEIYASPASLVGSIGVVYNGFGFPDLMQKLGISRRLQTSGVNKNFLDPFSPAIDSQKQKLQIMLNQIHQQFISRVQAGRGSRLKINDEMFSGLFWTGEQSLAMGLIDGFASAGQLARDLIKINQVVDYTHEQGFFDRMSKHLGAGIAGEMSTRLGLSQHKLIM